MIKVSNGSVEAHGRQTEIEADIIMLLKWVMQEDSFDFDSLLKTAKMTDAEIKADTKKLLKDILELLDLDD